MEALRLQENAYRTKPRRADRNCLMQDVQYSLPIHQNERKRKQLQFSSGFPRNSQNVKGIKLPVCRLSRDPWRMLITSTGSKIFGVSFESHALSPCHAFCRLFPCRRI